MFGTFYNVAEQHGSGHRSDAPRHRRHPAGNLANARIKIANQSGLGTGNADVDADCARFDHVSGDQAWPPCGRNHDVSPSSVAGQLDSPGVAQGDRGVLALPRQQQSQRSADRGPTSDQANRCAAERNAIAAEQFDDATRRAWQGTGHSQHQLAEVDRMQAVGILVGIDQSECRVVIQTARQW